MPDPTNSEPAHTVTSDLPPFAAVPRWLVEAPTISDRAVRAYALLTRYAGLPQGAMPALGTLAAAVGVSRDTMRRALYELRDAGVVVIEPRQDHRGQTSNRYHLRLHPPSTHAPTPPGVSATGPPGVSATGPPSQGCDPSDTDGGSDTDVELHTPPSPDGSGGAPPAYPDEVVALTREFAEMVLANGHKLPARGSKAAEGWLSAMDLLVRRGAPGDGVEPTAPEAIREVMVWALQVSDFWPANIRSVPKFREKFTTLRAQAKRPTNGAARGAQLAQGYADAAERLRGRA